MPLRRQAGAEMLGALRVVRRRARSGTRVRLGFVAIAVALTLSPAGFGIQRAAAVVAPDVSVNSVLAAGTGTALAGTQSGHVSVVAYRTTGGAVTAKALVCTATCTQYKIAAPSIEFTWAGRVAVRGVISGLGSVDVTLDANAGNTRAYECVDLYASFAVQGEVVEPAYMGGLVGPWNIRTTGCGVWGTTAAIQYAVYG